MKENNRLFGGGSRLVQIQRDTLPTDTAALVFRCITHFNFRRLERPLSADLTFRCGTRSNCDPAILFAGSCCRKPIILLPATDYLCFSDNNDSFSSAVLFFQEPLPRIVDSLPTFTNSLEYRCVSSGFWTVLTLIHTHSAFLPP